MLRIFNKKTSLLCSIFDAKNGAGFTLIELLVVITIIGLLVTISLVLIYRYQIEATETKIKTSIAQVRTLAITIFTDNSAYDSLCAVDNTLNENNPKLKILEDDIMRFNGNQPVICHASGIEYCIQSPLPGGGAFCIDGRGYSGEIANCTKDNIKCTSP